MISIAALNYDEESFSENAVLMAQLIMLGEEAQLKFDNMVKFEYNGGFFNAKINYILNKIDKRTGRPLEEDPDDLR